MAGSGFLARVFDIRGRNDGFRWSLSERQIACLRSASLGYATRAKYQALPEAEQRALLDLINEPCSDRPWLTPQGKAALSQVKS